MKEYLEQFDRCLQHEPSFCSADCPFNVDVDAFVSRLQEGRFNAAYKAYRDATGFPFIASEICSAPCKGSCLRNAVASGEPIQLDKLEKATLAYVDRKDPTRYNVPGKNKSVAIIGAGISGMACALRMATKKYRVTIYEKTETTGGKLLDIIDPKILRDDFELQMQHLKYTIHFNTEITSLEEVIQKGHEENEAAAQAARSSVASVMRAATTHAAVDANATYDAIYIATGEGGNDFGLLADFDEMAGGPCKIIGTTAVFAGGSLLSKTPEYAMADGLDMATAIDNYTLTKVLKYPSKRKTKIAIDETAYVKTAAVVPEAPIYTREEAIEEAKRCMLCQCNSCRLHCDLTEYVHKWPLRLKDEIVATTAPGRSELHATPAVRLINTCTHCGLCRDTCPEDIDLDGLIQAARFRMHKLDKMPWAFNDFFLKDMAFSNGEKSYLCRSAGSADAHGGTSKYAFFPGCQLGSSAPELVIDAYEYLLKHEPDTGIMLGCCGVPAIWAGDEELHEAEIERIRNDWEGLGKPVMILACPTCKNNFARYLPEIETIFIYDFMAGRGIDSECLGDGVEGGRNLDAGAFEKTYAVFDPCATDAGDEVRESVRSLCGMMGIKLEALPVQEKWTACCSYGGHGAIADPEFTKFVREKRIGESQLPYITYCINCRDAFMSEGKESVHLLNLIFGRRPHLDTITKRRENRIELKSKLLRRFWNEAPEEVERSAETAKAEAGGKFATEDREMITVEISPELKKKLSDEYILESDVANVISFCERTGRTLRDTEKDTLTGYRKIGNMTYWVEYRKTADPDKFELVNAYSHRMEIDLEMIWNGEKVNISM